ncbi:MAG TPA: hypothetical protein VIL52_04660, partial [Bacteroidota bacterium]
AYDDEYSTDNVGKAQLKGKRLRQKMEIKEATFGRLNVSKSGIVHRDFCSGSHAHLAFPLIPFYNAKHF